MDRAFSVRNKGAGITHHISSRSDNRFDCWNAQAKGVDYQPFSLYDDIAQLFFQESCAIRKLLSREQSFQILFIMHSTKLYELFNLPRIDNAKQLASALHLTCSLLNELFCFSRREYYNFRIPKKSGGERLITVPSERMKAIQSWILRNILDRISPSQYATAYRKKYSILQNVSQHETGLFFLIFDLKDFFPSIKEKEVFYFFNSLGYDGEVLRYLTRFCCYNGSIPQGAVTSPALSNLIAFRLDKRLGGYAEKKKYAFTRYADDITFSSSNRNVLNYSKSVIVKIIQEESFTINEAKTHFAGPGAQCKITGLVKNSSQQHFSVGRKKKNHMRSVIFNLIVNNRVIDNSYQSMDSVFGWLQFVKSVEMEECVYLSKYCERLRLRKNNEI